MKRVLSWAFVVALIVPFVAQAQAKPDFSGTWTLDPARSEPAGGGGGGRGGGGGGRGGGGPVVIKQTATEITIGMNTYKLDGTPTEVQMGRGGGGGAAAKATAKWDGAKLVITTTGDAGGTPFTTTQTRSLSADGKEMTVEGTGGRGPTKQVFTKTM